MNLFVLDSNIDKCAEYHVDKHVSKMILESAQLLTTALWIDHVLGFVPRVLDSKELGAIKEFKATQPHIEERTFTRYLSTHENHPCSIWVRSSLDNYEWTQVYANALASEAVYRGYKYHASCVEVNRMPDPTRLPRLGLTRFAMAMPDELKSDDPITSYRNYYRTEKAALASWTNREKPEWWENK